MVWIPAVRCARLALVLMALASLSALSGCGANTPGWASLNPSDWSNQRIADEPLVLDLAGPISVDVGTFAGNVTIEADPDLSKGEVTIVREGLHGFGRSKEAKASLSDITASVDLVAADTSRGQLGQTLRIRAETANAEPHFQRAHVYIKAPAIDGVFVATDDGNVMAKHVEGAMDIETSNGLVSVRTNLTLQRPVTIINSNGDIILRMRGEGSAAFDAQTINGRVSADIRYGSLNVASVTRDDTYQATLNQGTNKVVLRTTNGDIKIAVMAENEEGVVMPSDRKKPKDEPLVTPATQPE